MRLAISSSIYGVLKTLSLRKTRPCTVLLSFRAAGDVVMHTRLVGILWYCAGVAMVEREPYGRFRK